MILPHKTWFWWFRQEKEGSCEFLFERMTISNLQDLLGYMFIICNYIITGTLQKTLQHALRRQSHYPEELMQKFKMEIKVIYYDVSSHMVLKRILKNTLFFLNVLKGFEIISQNYIIIVYSVALDYILWCLYVHLFPKSKSKWALCTEICSYIPVAPKHIYIKE